MSVFRCSCGGSARATSNPPAVALDVVQTVREMCLAAGHREVDAVEFKRIRAKQRRDERRS